MHYGWQSRHIEIHNVSYAIMKWNHCLHLFLITKAMYKNSESTANSESSLTKRCKLKSLFGSQSRLMLSLLMDVSFCGSYIGQPRSMFWTFLTLLSIIMYLIDRNQRHLFGVRWVLQLQHQKGHMYSVETKIHT